jgi:putative ABC transport system permease protein
MKNQFLTSIRQLKKSGLFTFLNIIGLAIGISATWIIIEVIQYEYSFDQKLPDLAHRYQFVTGDALDPEDNFVGVPLGMAPLLVEQKLEDVELVPIYTEYAQQVYVPQADGSEKMWDDQEDFKSTFPSYFDFIPYTWKAGNPQTALLDPSNVVLTQERAMLYFPNMDAETILGQSIRIDSSIYQVSGIIEKPHFPMSFKGEAFFRIKATDWNNPNWHGSNSNHTLYALTKDQKKLAQLLEVAQNRYQQIAAKDHAEYGVQNRFKVVKVEDKHFSPDLDVEGTATDEKILYGLMAIAGFLLLLAIINYINLSTAMIPNRAKEIGIRKTLGASPNELSAQYLIETMLITTTALLASWPMVQLFKYVYPEFIPQEMNQYANPWYLFGFLFILLVILTFLNGLYPSFIIRKLRSIETLKGRIDTKITGNRLTLRKSFIVFQFIIAQFFIISALVMGMQLRYTLHKDLGFTHDAVIQIQMPYKAHHHPNTDPFNFKNALQRDPKIQGVTLGHDPQSPNHWGTVYHYASDSGKVQLQTPRKYVDADYLSFYEMELLAGRSFRQADTANEVVINEAAAEILGFATPEAAIGQYLEQTYGPALPIVGVVKNFHQKSLRQRIEPLAMLSSSDRNLLQYFHIKLPNDRGQWKESLSSIEKIWKQTYPNAPFDFSFTDEKIKHLYKNEQRTASLIELATGITIFISCLGLFGLTTLTAYQRVKEIGIRKVLGASILSILNMLSKDFIRLILIALVITVPIVYYAMQRWLEDFAYKISLSWWIFALGGVGAIVIALITISFQSIKAALTNPVESLRDE